MSSVVNINSQSVLPVTRVTAPPATKGWNIIQEVAKRSLIELGIALAFAGVTCLFVASFPAAATLVITAVTVVAINTLFRTMGGAFQYGVVRIDNPKKWTHSLCQGGLNVFNFLAPINFTTLDSTTRDVLIHESGHAAAASVLYKNADPKITVFPLRGGVTEMCVDELSRVGRLIGDKTSRLVLAAAGPAAAVFTSTLHFGLARYYDKSHPTLSRYLRVTAVVSLIWHSLYALTALSPQFHTPGHDFVALWIGGIHPLASIASMVAFPIIVKIGLSIYDSCKKQNAQGSYKHVTV